LIKQKIKITLLYIFLISFFLSGQEPELTAKGAVLMDYQTGRILYEKEGSTPRPPASMTKVITLYLGCRALEEHKFTMDTEVKVTSVGSAFSRPPGSSLMLLEEGQSLTYETLLKGIAVSSGNDGAYQLAELISGNPDDFVNAMNLLVYSLGLGDMFFEDPDGWSEFNRVTPLDYARFARQYINEFPWALEKLHSLESLTYPQPENMALNGLIRTPRTKKNTNWLLGKVEGVDGLKTGYIDESGFNLTGTAKRGDTRFIAVIMGVSAADYQEGLHLRADETEALLEYGFENWTTAPLPYNSQKVKVYKGKKEEVTLIPEEIPLYTLSRDELSRVEIFRNETPWVKAPLPRGTAAGSVSWFLDGEKLGESLLITDEELKKGSFFHNFIDLFEILLYNISHREKDPWRID
jgi:D-alanyl-D-alanine carboxypeptidase (penicillin-binding protein 5/6)